MLNWAITFLVIAIIAAVLGFGGIAGTAVGIAKISSPSSCYWRSSPSLWDAGHPCERALVPVASFALLQPTQQPNNQTQK